MIKVNKRITVLFVAVMSIGLLQDTNLHAGCNNPDGTVVPPFLPRPSVVPLNIPFIKYRDLVYNPNGGSFGLTSPDVDFSTIYTNEGCVDDETKYRVEGQVTGSFDSYKVATKIDIGNYILLDRLPMNIARTEVHESVHANEFKSFIDNYNQLVPTDEYDSSLDATLSMADFLGEFNDAYNIHGLLQTSHYYHMGQPRYSVISGTVIEVVDGYY